MIIAVLVPVNYTAVVVAAIAAFAVGSFWYSPIGFGKQWMKLRGIDPSSMTGMKFPAALMLQEFIAIIITALLIAEFSAWVHAGGITAGLVLGFWLWVGFVAPLMYSAVLWEKSPLKLYFINVGLRFITILLMAGIIVGWQ